MTDTPSGPRRRFPRVRLSFDVDVRVEPVGKPARTVGGRLVVLGAGGALLELDDAFLIGSLMHVRFELPTLGEIGCPAIVRNAIEGSGVGVEFLDIAGVEHRRIVAFVTKHQVDLALRAKTTATTTKPTSAHAFELLLNSLEQTGSWIEAPLRPGDRRRAARYVGQLPVGYRWRDGTVWFNGITENISATGLLFALDYADPCVIRDRPAPPDDPLELAVELRTTPASQLPVSVNCSVRCVRTIVAPGRIVLGAIGVHVDTWQLGKAL